MLPKTPEIRVYPFALDEAVNRDANRYDLSILARVVLGFVVFFTVLSNPRLEVFLWTSGICLGGCLALWAYSHSRWETWKARKGHLRAEIREVNAVYEKWGREVMTALVLAIRENRGDAVITLRFTIHKFFRDLREAQVLPSGIEAPEGSTYATYADTLWKETISPRRLHLSPQALDEVYLSCSPENQKAMLAWALGQPWENPDDGKVYQITLGILADAAAIQKWSTNDLACC